MRKEDIFIITVDRVDPINGQSYKTYCFYKHMTASKVFAELVMEFKKEVVEWDRPPYLTEITPDSFEWYEEGRYKEQHFAVRIERKNIYLLQQLFIKSPNYDTIYD